MFLNEVMMTVMIIYKNLFLNCASIAVVLYTSWHKNMNSPHCALTPYPILLQHHTVSIGLVSSGIVTHYAERLAVVIRWLFICLVLV